MNVVCRNFAHHIDFRPNISRALGLLLLNDQLHRSHSLFSILLLVLSGSFVSVLGIMSQRTWNLKRELETWNFCSVIVTLEVMRKCIFSLMCRLHVRRIAQVVLFFVTWIVELNIRNLNRTFQLNQTTMSYITLYLTLHAHSIYEIHDKL